MRPSTPRVCASLALAFTAGCSDDASNAPTDAGVIDVMIPDRMQGERAPRTADCDAIDPTRCALPWPSNTFAVADARTSTGLRVSIPRGAYVQGDDPAEANRADGFSRLSPVMTGFAAHIEESSLGDGTTGAVRLLVAQPGEHFGEVVPLRYKVVQEGPPESPESLIVAYPRVPLRAGTDYVAVVLDQFRVTAGAMPAASNLTRAALGLRAPTTLEEAQLRAYHAPARALLTRASLDPARVLRVWDFTTRSREQPTANFRAMRERVYEAMRSGSVSVVIDRVEARASGPAAMVVRGHLAGVPHYVDMNHRLHRNANDALEPVDTHDAPFRVLVPRGMGNYRVVLYGHGTGGDVDDSSFDAQIAGAGAAKVGIQFEGWNGDQVITSFLRFRTMLRGVEQSTAGLLQSVVDGSAVFQAMVGGENGQGAILADALAAPMIGGQTNPAAGRRPMADGATWAGGSLGGTMGLVITRSEPRLRGAVVNVPGAGWTHFLTGSNLYAVARVPLQTTYRTQLDTFVAVGMSQLNWDDVDGGVWADAVDNRQPFLLQESMGDPVLPNIGSEVAAASVGAVQVGAVLQPVSGVERTESAAGRSAITQYRVPRAVTTPLDVHGFAARDTPAGVAAREQIESFLRSVWTGESEITVPPTCTRNTPAGSCDFASSQ